jgi:hypothetical protein
VTRVAAQRVRGSRTLGAIGKAVGTTLRSWGLVLRQLWLEVTGLVFLAMAGTGALWLVRQFSKHSSARPTSGRTAVAICFILTFAWFGVTSFWRVRKNASKPRN